MQAALPPQRRDHSRLWSWILFLGLVALPGTPALGQTVPLKLYWHPQRGDTLTVASPAGERDAQAAGYRLIRTEGYVHPTPQPGMVPLKLYWSDHLGDSFTTATPQGEQDAQAAGYRFIRTEGYVYPSPQPGTVPLKLYRNAGWGDNFTVATLQGEQDAQASAYRLVRIEGYVLGGPQVETGRAPGPAPAVQMPARVEGPPGLARADLKGNAPSPTTILLQWQGAFQAVEYQVHRDGQLVATLPGTATGYTDTGRRPKTSYTYWVTALDPGRSSPGMSGPVKVATPPVLPPGEVRATASGPSTIVVSWAARPEAGGYEVSRNGTPIQQVQGTTHTDHGLAPGTYTYTVRALYPVAGAGVFRSEPTRPVTLALRPFNLVVVGDSIMWGQGLREESKFSTKVKRWLEGKLNRQVDLHAFAHSGAVIGFALNQADETRAKHGEVPWGFPTIAYQAAGLLPRHVNRDDVDLVLMDGCINDIQVTKILAIDPMVGPDWVRRWTRWHCGDRMRDLLTLAMEDRWFPNAKIVIPGYYQIVSAQSDLRALTGFLRSLGVFASSIVPGAEVVASMVDAWVRRKLVAQSAAFNEESTSVVRALVDEINRKYHTTRVRFASVPFQPEHAFGAPKSWLWPVPTPFLRDEAWEERQQVCPTAGYIESIKCQEAAGGHPNQEGAQAYADAITRELDQWVPEWQAQHGPTVEPPPSPSLYVQVDYGPRTPTGGTLAVYAADWATGVGVEGRVRLDGVERGSIGDPITYEFKRGPTGEVTSQGQAIIGRLPIGGNVVVPGYTPGVFQVPAPKLDDDRYFDDSGK